MKAILFILLITFGSSLVANDLGRETYTLTCKTCHAPKIAMGIGAPAAFDKKAWDLRFKNAETAAKNNPKQFKTAMDYLLYKVTIGKGLMPHHGLCKEANVANKNCSDQALIAAINYMAAPR